MEEEEELHKKDILLGGAAISANTLLVDNDLDRGINLTLEILGAVTHSDRIYVFENETAENNIKLTSLNYEWSRDPAFPSKIMPISVVLHFSRFYLDGMMCFQKDNL
jgi:hypothetical protein